MLLLPLSAPAQRAVDFPPATGKPPPPVKDPPRTQSSGEDSGIIPNGGPTMRKTQQRTPPPPTNLTVMYKLRYGSKLKYTYEDGQTVTFDQWQSYPQDGYLLMTRTNQRLADGMNYQYDTKPLASPGGFDPVEIPLLYMTGDYDFTLTDEEVENLRKYLLDGGTILFNAARGRDDFTRAVVSQMRRVFPDKLFMKLPLDHPVFNARYRISQVMTTSAGVQYMQAPEVYALDIATRAAAILAPWGMGSAWTDEKTYNPGGRHLVGESAIRLGVNIVAYVLGNTEYGRFLAQEFPVYSGQTRPGDVYRFAIARYHGSYDDYPALQNSVLRALQDNTTIGVDYSPTFVSLEDPMLGAYPLLFMTGHYDFELTDEQVKSLRQYLSRGGMLLASAADGLKPFDLAFRRELARVFPDNALVNLPPSHPIFASGWLPVEKVQYTPAALRDDPMLEYPLFQALLIDGRIAVLYTPWDLMSAVNRQSNAYAKGVASPDAVKLVINVITYTLSH